MMASAPGESYGGYEYDFVKEAPEKFICSICTKVQRDPHITSCCGQHFCESCLENWFKKQGKKSCPHCREEKDFNHFLNKDRKREINELKIQCTNHKEGCQWIGELGNLQTHLDSESGCGYVKVRCTNRQCSKHMKRKNLQDHLNRKCLKRRYNCKYCGYENTYQTITTGHYNKCPEYPLECPNECGAEVIKRKDMSAHRRKCPEELVECPNVCKPKEAEQNTTLYSLAFPFVPEVRKLKRKDLPHHFSNECYLRDYKCEHCHHENTYEKITGFRDGVRVFKNSHYDTCREFPLKCPSECRAESIKRKDMSTHRDKCPEEPLECPNKCEWWHSGHCRELKRKHIPYHLSNECYLRKYKCKHCGLEDTYERITGMRDGERQEGISHYDTCPEYPVECPNECGAETMKRKDMSTHRDKCPLEPMVCPFQEAGCETKLVRRDFDDHVKTQTQQHLLLTFQKMKALRTTCETLSKRCETLSKRCDELEKTQTK